MPIEQTGFHVLAVGFPKVGRKYLDTGVEQIGIFQHLVIEVVLRIHTQCAGFDTHVDILADKDNFTVKLLFVQEHHDTQYRVVRFAVSQR